MTTKTELAATVSNINYLRGVKEGQPGWLILAYYSMGKPCQLEMVIEDGPLAVRIEPKTARMSIKEAGSFLAGTEFGIKVLSGSSLSLLESAGREPVGERNAETAESKEHIFSSRTDECVFCGEGVENCCRGLRGAGLGSGAGSGAKAAAINGALMRLKTDKLLVSVYAKHGDTCNLAPHCKSLGCASGHEPDDYILSAKFAYLQEAIDYAQAISTRGVRARLVSRICPGAPYVSDWRIQS